MRARLFCKVGEHAGASFEIASEARIGRSADNEIALDSGLISNHHARLKWDSDNGCYRLEDLDSLNGTELDGLRVQRAERLGHLHVITLAKELDFVFQDLQPTSAPASARADVVEPTAGTAPSDPLGVTQIEQQPLQVPSMIPLPKKPVDQEGTRIEQLPFQIPQNLGAPATAPSTEPTTEPSTGPTDPPTSPFAKPKKGLDELFSEGLASSDSPAEEPPTRVPALEIQTADSSRQRFILEPGDNLLGRGRKAQIQLDSPSLSRRHAVLHRQGEQVTVSDLGSQNKTFVAGQAIDQPTVVEVGSEIHFGELEARLIWIEADPTEKDLAEKDPASSGGSER